jgi:hypothetical protein
MKTCCVENLAEIQNDLKGLFEKRESIVHFECEVKCDFCGIAHKYNMDDIDSWE